MGWICLDCGNESSFTGDENVSGSGTRNSYFDSEGSVNDYDDVDWESMDGEGDFENVECTECDSHNVEWETDNNILNEIRVRNDTGNETSGYVPIPAVREKTWQEEIEGK